jgi:hypothetical protein
MVFASSQIDYTLDVVEVITYEETVLRGVLYLVHWHLVRSTLFRLGAIMSIQREARAFTRRNEWFQMNALAVPKGEMLAGTAADKPLVSWSVTYMDHLGVARNVSAVMDVDTARQFYDMVILGVAYADGM